MIEAIATLEEPNIGWQDTDAGRLGAHDAIIPQPPYLSTKIFSTDPSSQVCEVVVQYSDRLMQNMNSPSTVTSQMIFTPPSKNFIDQSGLSS